MERVGEGKGVPDLLELSLVLAFASMSGGTTPDSGEGEGDAFALTD